MKLLKFVVLVLVVFGGAGAASWFWTKQQETAEKSEEGGETSGVSLAAKGRQGHPARLKDLPVPVRSKHATAEEIARLAWGLQKQQDTLRKREESLEGATATSQPAAGRFA